MRRILPSLAGFFWAICGPKNSNKSWRFSMHLNGLKMARGMWCHPSREESLQSKEVGNLCVISERSITATCFIPSTFKGTHSHGGCAFHLIVPSVVEKKKTQGYVNKMLSLWGGKFNPASKKITSGQIHDIETLFPNLCYTLRFFHWYIYFFPLLCFSTILENLC